MPARGSKIDEIANDSDELPAGEVFRTLSEVRGNHPFHLGPIRQRKRHIVCQQRISHSIRSEW
jgi:hypothetical protein